MSAAPFVAGTYGLLYGRLNLETTHQRIRLQRLPKAFEGFRIVQLSDFHISPFMSAEEIRKYVAIANQERGDLVVLTGDFLTYARATQGAVVQAVSASTMSKRGTPQITRGIWSTGIWRGTRSW